MKNVYIGDTLEKLDFDIVYLTNTPSFYKLNLMNEVARNCEVLMVFYGYGSEAVNTQLNGDNWNFKYIFIHEGDANKRNKLSTFINLLKVMRKIKTKKILYTGWLAPEYNIFSFFSPKSKNVCVCESSVFESSFNGITGLIKRCIINRMSSAMPSGYPHKKLFEMIDYNGEIVTTGGVGIFNKFKRTTKITHKPLRYLYIGRLVDVKNVDLLIEEFNDNGKSLTIVGDGVLRSTLESKAKRNIKFTGFIDNEDLSSVTSEADVFILPSKSEPWGLVVEEAIYWGLPVIVSDKVGSSIDMVKNPKTGIIFESESIHSLHNAILEMETHFDSYKRNVDIFDFDERDQAQINAYLKVID